MPDIGPDTFAGETNERTDEEIAESLAAKIADADGLAGAVGVARNGHVLFVDGYGSCDREAAISCTGDTVFDIGSITKPMTAMAIATLEAEGRLGYDDQLIDYFPNIRESKSRITIEQLLTHTSGFRAAIGLDYSKVQWEEFERRSARTCLRSDPGEEFRYSNIGYSYLGRIIELTHEDGYESYLKERVYDPAGMERTGYVIPKWDEAEVAIGYNGANDGLRWGSPLEKKWDDDGPYWNLRANGGLLSSANDMLRWHLALRDGLVDEDTLDSIFTRWIDEGYGDTFYGFGWTIMDTDVGEVRWHDGGNGKFFAVVFWLVELDTFVVAMTNAASPDSVQMALDLARISATLDD